VGKKTDYHIVQEIEIKYAPNKEHVEAQDELISFQDEMVLNYKYGKDDLIASIEIDYSLYSLLKKVVKGYIPSINDRRVNVNCVDFINKISAGGKKDESIIIRDLSHKKPIEFILEYDDTFGYKFEER
jgi:DNA phosphorothioation-dependent restriction protein DptF